MRDEVLLLAAADDSNELRGALTPIEFIAAAEGDAKKLPRVNIDAYTGEPMNVGYSAPVIVELSGVRIAAGQVPFLRSHDPTQIVGHGTVEVTATKIKAAGVVSGVGPAAAEVRDLAANQFPWQASIGGVIDRREFVEVGQKVSVNGRTYAGPLIVARAMTLREISFVPLGADGSTSATVAASSHSGDSPVNFEAWLKAKQIDATKLDDATKTTLKAAYDAEIAAATPPSSPPAPSPNPPADPLAAARLQAAAEVERCDAIRAIATQYNRPQITLAAGQAPVSLEAHAIREGWSRDQTELHALRASRPAAPAIHIAGRGQPAGRQVLEAALCVGFKLAGADKQYKPEVLDAAHQQFRGGMGLHDLLLECAYASGYTGRASMRGHAQIREVLQAAFSNADISGILSNTANKFVLASFNAVEDVWRRISIQSPVSDFKTVTRYRMTGKMEFDEIGPDGRIQHGELGEESMSNKAKTHAKMLSITREDIINDDLGALLGPTGATAMLGRGAAQKLNKVFWTKFLDNSSFFTTARGNLLHGVANVLSSDGLAVAEAAFLELKGDDNNPLGITPSILLTPVGLGVTARELYQSTQVNTGGSSTKTKVPNANIWAGKYRPETSAYLANAAYSGNSATAYYLLADPATLAAIEVVFLNGVETPTIESADADFSLLGVDFRGVFDFGVEKQEYRAGVKVTGVAAPT